MQQPALPLSVVNDYLAYKQHLLPRARSENLVQVTRDIVALHATNPTGPYLSLWARMPGFQRRWLKSALEEERELVRMLCMRMTLHAIPSNELASFFQAFADERVPAELRSQDALMVSAGLCDEQDASDLVKRLWGKIWRSLDEMGAATVRELGQVVPELGVKVQHSQGKPYAGEFSLGSRFVASMCNLGLLIRARTRGTWRSSLHEYARLNDWLPAADLGDAWPGEARNWLVSRYLSAFGPATMDDIHWWTGFTKNEAREAVRDLDASLVKVQVPELGGEHLMLSGDLKSLLTYTPSKGPYAFYLPGLDPYIMGYRDRRRFLSPQHQEKVFDRSGNAMPTVWVSGRVVGAWGQRKDGSVVYGLFGAVDEESRIVLDQERARLDGFLNDEVLPQRSHTPYTREHCT